MTANGGLTMHSLQDVGSGTSFLLRLQGCQRRTDKALTLSCKSTAEAYGGLGVNAAFGVPSPGLRWGKEL